MTANTLLRATRPPFLVLTPACVLLGVGVAGVDGGEAGRRLAELMPAALLALLGALLAHASVNLLNEWSDFRTGLDTQTRRTPFSGGSGALPEQPHALQSVLMLSLGAMAGTVLIGVWFALQVGWALLPLGMLGMLIIATYTDVLNKHPLACLLAPGAGFGLVMVPGVAFVLTGHYSPLAWLAALVPFFQVNNLLLLNQYPDIQADAAAGRRHLLIVHGERAGAVLYGLFTLGAQLVVLAGVARGLFPSPALLALVPSSLGWVACYGAWRHGGDIARQPQYLGLNVAASVATPAVLGVTLLVAS
jgi:1,4-dihydroxy-2-naphthoate octaprenyltransferase